jgi:hypothetical protein
MIRCQRRSSRASSCGDGESRPAKDRAIVDAGLKALAFDSGPPLVCDESAAIYERASDEHGCLAVSSATNRLQIADKIRLIPGHCDLTGPTEISWDKNFLARTELPQALQAGGLPSPRQPLARRDDLLSEGGGSDPASSPIAKIGTTPVVQVWIQKRQTGSPHPGNHLILSKSQQNIIAAELIADGLTVDDSSEGAAEISHMITFAALLDHEVIAR